jgi:5'-deoxynucleotidase YfbR-like HD superfamily hydrolase
MNYEQTLFQIAPWTQEIMQIAKQLNNGNLLKGRTGWIRRSVTNPESIYEHSCKVALAAWYLYKTDDAIATGAVHDFPEIFEEDYIPWEINSKDKKEKEYAAMTKLKNILPNGNYWFNA